MVRKVVGTALLVGAVFVFALLPPRPLRTSPASAFHGVVERGAYHIHTVDSDGALPRDEVALAASRAGLKFVVITDHGDGTRAPSPPGYLHGVLCVDGVEISTNQGHYVALAAGQSPYRLGGDADAVDEDVVRLGGFGIAAHPFSARAQLAWTDWSVPVAGLEWLNADSEWRDESRPRLARALLGYFWRPGGALASLLDRPLSALAKWDELAANRRLIGLAGHDAHGGFGEDDQRGRRLKIPSYGAMFRMFSTNAILDAPLSGNAATDSAALLEAIRRGRTFTAIDAIAGPAALAFTASAGGKTVGMGEWLPLSADAATFDVRSAVPSGASIVLVRDGQQVAESGGEVLEYSSRAGGAYRVEVRVPGAPGTPPIPWIVSNPIFRLPAADLPPEGGSHALAPWLPPLGGRSPDPIWRVEKSEGTSAALAGEAASARLRYQLGTERSPFAALVTDLPAPHGEFDAVAFRISSPRPMRLSVQLRFASSDGDRWRKSVYVDSEEREIVVPVKALRPADHAGHVPPSSRASSVLFVADTVNANGGEAGEFTVRGFRLGRSGLDGQKHEP